MKLKTRTGDDISISCTWGDGPDVCVNIKYDPKLTRTHFNLNGFFPLDLTGDEAISVGNQLIISGNHAKSLDKSYQEYLERQANDD